MNIFKNSVIVSVFLLGSMVVAQPIYAEETVIKKTQTHNIFKGALLSIWARFKSFNPHSRQNAKSTAVYTAGIRGAESTGTLLQPYWINDLSQNVAFQKELALFGQGLTELDNGKLKKATGSLEKFLKEYPKSSLKPNALFAQGISYAGLGDGQQSVKNLNLFISQFPNHPLASDAESLIQQLK